MLGPVGGASRQTSRQTSRRPGLSAVARGHQLALRRLATGHACSASQSRWSGLVRRVSPGFPRDPYFRYISRAMLNLEQLAALLAKEPAAARAPVREFALGGHTFNFNRRPAIMGVINLSADSWYRESVKLTTESAIRRGRVLQAQGAEIIDVGAESTLAHAARTDEAAQNSRLVPVVRALAEAGIVVSVETYQPAVTRACLDAGARVLNLTGTEGGEEIFRLVADHDAAVILCHIQGRNVREVSEFDFSGDPVERMYGDFARLSEAAQRSGVQKIFLDPGLGFYYRNLQDSAVRVRHQMSVFLNTFRLRTLGFPICHALPHAFEYFGEEVRSAEAFFAVLAALGGTHLFRTHEVPRVKAVLDTLALL
jgi:dihydropteroate synthase